MLWAADETALDLFARRPTRGFLTGLRALDATVSSASIRGGRAAQSDGFQPRHVVEVGGDDATPTALVLLHVIAAFLTRAPLDESEKVFVFDHECALGGPLLLRIVRDKLATSVDDEAERMTLARRLVARVVVYHCRDSFQWLATLNKLHFDLLEAPPGPSLLIIHCVGSFHAIDKMIAKSVGPSLVLADHVFLILKQFIRHHSPIVFASKQTVVNVRGTWDAPEYMPTSWTSQVSKRIQLRVMPAMDGSQTTNPENHFEARSFSHGKSQTLSFRVDGLAFIDDTSPESFEDASVMAEVDVSTEVPLSMAIAEADTNAAQLWMH